MSIRTRTSPGIEIHEIDKSGYGQLNDYSIVNTHVFMTGFADKGEDYTAQWVNSLKTFSDYYGEPTTEAEKFLYMSVKEVLSKGGIPYVAKLPYSNDAKDSFAYVDYKVELDPSSSDIYLRSLSAADPNLTSYIEIKHVNTGALTPFSELPETSTIRMIISKASRLAKEAELEIYPDKWETIDDIKAGIIELTNLYSQDDINPEHKDIETLNDILTALNELLKDAAEQFNVTMPLLDIETLDKYRISRQNMMTNMIRIVNINRNIYDEMTIRYKDESNNWKTKKVECLGVMPVIVSPVNALFYQGLIKRTQRIDYNSINNFEYTENLSAYQPIVDFKQFKSLSANAFDNVNFTIPISSVNIIDQTVSKIATSQFPLIQFSETTTLEDTYLKQIGVVVFNVYSDPANDDKLNFSVLESFVGSLDPLARNSAGKSIYIDTVINDQSQYINLFSNVTTKSSKYEDASTILISNQVGTSLGFTKRQSEKRINYTESIIKPLNMIFERNRDPNMMPIDIVVDAGVSNIAQLVWSSAGAGNRSTVDIDWTRLTAGTTLDNSGWRAVIQKFTNFCEYTRKDCMFIADGLRAFCLEGNQKSVRRTALTSTIENTIVPRLPSMAGINSSYVAGYSNWFQVLDDTTGDYMWLPPSIKALGVYIFCDAYCQKWSAPAGLNRGVITGVVDCAFSPDNDEAGKIYSQGWNYAINYPLGGIVLEGQKTMQLQKSAFDRVNVRRLFLYLEKQVALASRYFVYEQNTAYNRQRFIDNIRPILEKAKIDGGIVEYGIKCDDSLNTPDVIDNNELRCIIGIKPVKVLEWIICDFVCTNQSVKVNEIIDSAG